MSETQPTPPPRSDTPPPPSGGGASEANQWAMYIHFSILAGVIVPYAGLILPIVIWQIKKDEFPSLTPHAYVVLNWIISAIIYSVACLILILVLIGFLGFIALAVLSIIFPIIGGIKANEGELWEYPLSIRFLK